MLSNRLTNLAFGLTFVLGLTSIFKPALFHKIKFATGFAFVLFYTLLRVLITRSIYGPKRPTWGYGFEVLMTVLNSNLAESSKKITLSNVAKVRKRMGNKPMAKPPINSKYVAVSVPGTEITGEWNYSIPKAQKKDPVVFPLPSVPETVFKKLQTRPVMLYLHGGAYIGMNAGTHRSWCRKLSVSADIVVLSLNYRLAPENPFPNGLIDAIETYKWLTSSIKEGGLGIHSKSIIVMGDSAGGGLSTALTLAIIQGKNNPIFNPLNYPFKSLSKAPINSEQLRQLEAPGLLILLSPWLDIECTNASWTQNSEYCYLPFLGNRIGTWYAGHHQTSKQEQVPLNHPLVSPIHGDFNGFPPTLLQVGGSESLVEDARIFKEKAKVANVQLVYEEYEDMCHVFHMFYSFVPDQTQMALSSIVNQIEELAKKANHQKTPLPKL